MVIKWVLIISLVIIAYSNFEAEGEDPPSAALAENPPISLILSRQRERDEKKTCGIEAGCDESCTAGGWLSTTDIDVGNLSEKYCETTKCKKEDVTSPAGFKYTCDTLIRTGDGCKENEGCLEECSGLYFVLYNRSEETGLSKKQIQHRSKLCKDGMVCYKSDTNRIRGTPMILNATYVCKKLCEEGSFCNLFYGCNAPIYFDAITPTNAPGVPPAPTLQELLEESGADCLTGKCARDKDGYGRCVAAKPSAGGSLTPFVGILGVTLLLISIQ